MLNFADISLHPACLTVTFPFCKFSLGRCPSIFIPSRPTDLCPVQAVLSYILLQGQYPEFIFLNDDRFPVFGLGFSFHFRAHGSEGGVGIMWDYLFQLQSWSCNFGSCDWDPRGNHSEDGVLVIPGFCSLHRYISHIRLIVCDFHSIFHTFCPPLFCVFSLSLNFLLFSSPPNPCPLPPPSISWVMTSGLCVQVSIKICIMSIQRGQRPQEIMVLIPECLWLADHPALDMRVPEICWWLAYRINRAVECLVYKHDTEVQRSEVQLNWPVLAQPQEDASMPVSSVNTDCKGVALQVCLGSAPEEGTLPVVKQAFRDSIWGLSIPRPRFNNLAPSQPTQDWILFGPMSEF